MSAAAAPRRGGSLRLMLAGDVMTGRAVDQVLPHPGDPRLYEPYARDARQYAQLAEAVELLNLSGRTETAA